MTMERPLPPHPLLPVREDWIARLNEEIIDPSQPIVDPHHHLWDRPGWTYLFPEFLSDIGNRHNLVASIYVQAGEMVRTDGPEELRSVGETEFVNGIAAMSASGKYGPARICAGIVGAVDLTIGSRAKAALEAHVRVAGDRFKGIRQMTPFHAEEAIRPSVRKYAEGILMQKNFREGFSCLAGMDMTFDVWVVHTQLDEVADLARQFPAARIVVDHVAGVIGTGSYSDRRSEAMAEWKRGLELLSAFENVYLKFGGLGQQLFGFRFHERELPPSSKALAQAWKPYFDTCLSIFGPKRIMFESNFPVDKCAFSYDVLWNAFKILAADLSSDEKNHLFVASACKAYKLEIPEIAAAH